MYAQIHAELFLSNQAAQAANDAALVSAVLLVAAEFDQSPPTTKAAALTKLIGILGEDTYASKAVQNALR